MKWTIRDKYRPSFGSKRDLCRFAWIPTRIGSEMIWLEYYYELQEYREFAKCVLGDSFVKPSKFLSGWITLKKYQVQ